MSPRGDIIKESQHVGLLIVEADLRPRVYVNTTAMRGNICRCGTYSQIRQAIHRAADLKARGGRS